MVSRYPRWESVYFTRVSSFTSYIDDYILDGPDEYEFNDSVWQIKEADLDISVEDFLDEFLGGNISHKEDGSIQLSQPYLIGQIINDLILYHYSCSKK